MPSKLIRSIRHVDYDEQPQRDEEFVDDIAEPHLVRRYSDRASGSPRSCRSGHERPRNRGRSLNPARDHWNRVVTLNSLTAEGNTPFYLKIEFQVFDLKGKPAEAGTAEVWWGPHRRYEVVASPSWNETSAPGEHEQPQTRQAYLIRALIEQTIHPMQGARIVLLPRK